MQADKIEAAIRKLVSGQGNMQADINRLKLTPLPAPGKPGKNGESPAMADIVREVLAQIRVPEDGKDADPVDLDAVSFKVLSQIPKPKDGKSPAMADIVNEVLAQIPKPKDGKSPSIDAVVREVLAQMPAPQVVEALAVEAKDGRPGRNGKDGKSVTKVKLEKGNQLAVWLDGVRRVVGKIELPKPPVEAFTPGGGRKVTKTVEVEKPLAGFIAYSDEQFTLSQDADAPSFLPGFVLTGTGWDLFDEPTGAVINSSGVSQSSDGLISFNPDKTGGGGTAVVYVFSETSTDGGTTFDLNEGSLRPVEISNSGESFKSAVSFVLDTPPGAIVRFRAFADGDMAFEPSSQTVLGGQTITGHSMIWNLSKNNG